MFETPTLETFASYNMNVALPAITLAAGTMVVLLIGLFIPQERKRWVAIMALAGISASFIMNALNFSPEQQSAFGGMFIADSFTAFLNAIILGGAFLSILISADYLKRAEIDHPEYYSLILLSAAGAMFMVGANDLLVVFVALELLSIPLYILAAFHATDPNPSDEQSLKSEESGMKYFILGAFASAFFVYGTALVYGAMGTTNLSAIFAGVPAILAGEAVAAQVLLLLGIALVFVGLGFKVAVVPFHMWTPDVYEGAPTPVTAYMSVVAKIGGFGALLRFMVVGVAGFALREGEAAAWQNAVQMVAALTLILGNVVALSQQNIKRMLAYSSIAHAGYILMAVAAVASSTQLNGLGEASAQAIAVYLLAYTLTNLGAFAIVIALEGEQGSNTTLASFSGLANSRPLLAAAMTVFMLSLTGIPLTGGFIGKWLVFGATIQAGLIPLAVVGVLTSVVSAFYYMRVVVNMYLNTDAAGSQTESMTRPLGWAIAVSAVGVLLLGILPMLIANWVSMVSLV